MLQLVRIFDELPDGFGDLVAEASGEGVRLIADGARFQDDGEAFFAAFLAGALAGVGGMTIELAASEPARRLGPVYVHPAMRRRGVATALASALIHEGFDSVGLLTVEAGTSGPFWLAQGFIPDTRGPWTHVMRRGRSCAIR